MSMTNPTNHVEIVTSVQRRRRWTASEKVRDRGVPLKPCGSACSRLRRSGSVGLHAILKRQALAAGLKPANHKRIYRVMPPEPNIRTLKRAAAERREGVRMFGCSDDFAS